MNDELDIELRSALRTAPTPLDADAADRIWHDIEAALRSPASVEGAAIDVVDVDEVDRATPRRLGGRAVVGWLAVAAAVVTVLVGVTAWRSGGEGGIGEVPTATTPTPVPYGEIPPLEDTSIFYLPDPMPDGWHVVQAERSRDLLMEQDWELSGPELATEPPIEDGVYRTFTVTFFNDRVDTFVQLGVVETGTSRIAQRDAGEEEIQVGGRDVVSGSPVDVGPSWMEGGVSWQWAQDGRILLMLVAGDAQAAEVLVAAIRHVPAATVLAAVDEGQVFARSLPLLDQVTLGNGASLSVRGPGDNGVAVCADARVLTCAFVGSAAAFGGVDQAFGWAGTQQGGFQYGWVRGPIDRLDFGTATVIERDGGTFVTDVAPDGTRVDRAPVLAGYPTVDWELIGMPRLADFDPDTGELVPITPVASGDAVAYGEVPPLDDASIFYLPDPMPEGWHVSQVLHGVDFPIDWVEAGASLDAVPQIPDMTFREFSVFLYRDDGRAFATMHVVETPVRHEDHAPERVTVEATEDGYAAAGLTTTAGWAWTLGGRKMDLSIVGDESLAEPLLDAIRPVAAATVLRAVADGQAAALSMPVIETLDLPNRATLTTRGPGDRVIAVCAEATISTCAFVSTIYGAYDVALGWAGTDAGGFSYGWVDGWGDGEFVTDVERAERRLAIPRTDLVGMPRLAMIDPDAGIVPITPVASGDAVAYGEVPPLDDASIFYLPDPMPEGWHVARVRPVIEEENEIEAEPGEFQRPLQPVLRADVLRSFQVDLVSDDGAAAQLVVTEVSRPRADADIASAGEATLVGRRDVRLNGSSFAGWPGGVSPFRDEIDRRTWTWVQHEREISLDGDLSDDDAAALIASIVPVRGVEVVAAVRAGQAFAAHLPVVAEQQVGSLRLTARGTDGQVLFLCAEGDGPTRCGSGLTQWNVPGVAQLEVSDGAGGVMLVAWVPAERDAEIVPNVVGDGAEITPQTYASERGAFVVLADGALEVRVPDSRLALNRPDRELIGMPRVAVTPAPETPSD